MLVGMINSRILPNQHGLDVGFPGQEMDDGLGAFDGRIMQPHGELVECCLRQIGLTKYSDGCWKSLQIEGLHWARVTSFLSTVQPARWLLSR